MISRVANVLGTGAAWIALLSMTANFILSSWTLDPIHDLFFTLTIGPFFPLVHASSVGFVLLATFWMAYVKNSIPLGVAFGFSSAAIHELILAGTSVVFLGWQEVVGGLYPIGLAIVLMVAWYKGTKTDRRTMIFIAGMMAMIDSALFFLHVGTPWPFPLLDNLLTVVLWMLPCVPWLMVARR